MVAVFDSTIPETVKFTIISIVGSCALNVLLKHNALNVRKNEMLVNSTVNVIKRTFNARNNSNALYVLFPKNLRTNQL